MKCFLCGEDYGATKRWREHMEAKHGYDIDAIRIKVLEWRCRTCDWHHEQSFRFDDHDGGMMAALTDAARGFGDAGARAHKDIFPLHMIEAREPHVMLENAEESADSE